MHMMIVINSDIVCSMHKSVVLSHIDTRYNNESSHMTINILLLILLLLRIVFAIAFQYSEFMMIIINILLYYSNIIMNFENSNFACLCRFVLDCPTLIYSKLDFVSFAMSQM